MKISKTTPSYTPLQLYYAVRNKKLEIAEHEAYLRECTERQTQALEQLISTKSGVIFNKTKRYRALSNAGRVVMWASFLGSVIAAPLALIATKNYELYDTMCNIFAGGVFGAGLLTVISSVLYTKNRGKQDPNFDEEKFNNIMKYFSDAVDKNDKLLDELTALYNSKIIWPEDKLISGLENLETTRQTMIGFLKSATAEELKNWQCIEMFNLNDEPFVTNKETNKTTPLIDEDLWGFEY